MTSDSCCPSHQVRWSLLLTWSRIPPGLFTSGLCPSNSPQLQGVLFLESSCPHLESLVFTFSRPNMSAWHWKLLGITQHHLSWLVFTFHTEQPHCNSLSPDDSICFPTILRWLTLLPLPEMPLPTPKAPAFKVSIFPYYVNWYGNTPFCLLLRILVAFVLSSLTSLLIIPHIQVVCTCLPG